jgi:cytochrome c oxidase assembly protein subunit 15
LGAAAGLVAIALVVVVFRTDRRRWLRQAAVGALALVILQGMLGGARVLFDERLVALIHGCVGPLFFAYLAGLVAATSGDWQAVPAEQSAAGTRLVRSCWILMALACLQLVIGAVVRHIPLSASPQVFRAALVFHLLVAGVLTMQIGLVVWQAMSARSARGLSGPSALLAILYVVQLALGAGTYVAKYSWPAWLGDYQFAAAHIVRERSLSQSLITTAHVAGGSLILFLATLLAMRASRCLSLARCESAGAAGWKPARQGRAAA